MKAPMSTVESEIQSDDELLQQATARLVNALDPERIYLFGSRARGDYRTESDYDLMVIVADGTSLKPHPMTIGWQVLRGLGLRTDVKALCHTDFYKQTHLKASLPTAVLRDGKLLYERDSGDDASVPPGRTVVRESSDASYDPVRINNTRLWVDRAKADLLAADQLIKGDFSMRELVMFHCQQSAEKAIKSLLTWHDCVFPKTHELEDLGKLLVQFDPTCSSDLVLIVGLSEWAIRGRYPSGLPLQTASEAAAALARVHQFLEALLQRLPENVKSNTTEQPDSTG